MTNVVIPAHHAMMNPLIRALNELGGSATIEELNSKATEAMVFSDDKLANGVKAKPSMLKKI